MPMRNRVVTKAILTLLAGAKDTVIELGEFWVALGSGYGSAYRRGGSGYVAELKRLRNQTDLKRKIYELARRRYITIRRVGPKLMVSLTNKGYTATFINQLQQASPQPKGRYTVVIFDIPEELRRGRNRFRLLLKQGGFKRLQQSVWVSAADSRALVVNFVRRSGLSQWVNVFYATDFFKLFR